MNHDASDAHLKNIVGGVFWGKIPARIGVAVSGGSDSLALLELLTHWTRARDVALEAATVDHRLRPEAAMESAQVAAFCAARGVPHQVLVWEGWDGAGNLQAKARDARYQLLAQWAREAQLDAVALGHTANDQAETFLMRLARSAGVDGLSAMSVDFKRHGIRFVRPVLQKTRAELRHYLQRHKIDWMDDPSNVDENFDRVRARAAFEHLRELGISEQKIASSAHNLSMASSALDHFTRLEAQRFIEEDRGDLILRAGPELHPEIERRLILAALQFIGGEPYPPRKNALGEMKYNLRRSGKTTLGGCVITQDGLTTRFARELNAVAGEETRTELFWDRRWSLDGPHGPDLRVRALGEAGLATCSDWRDTGLPRASLLASPAIWRGGDLIAAPLAGFAQGWSAKSTSFSAFLLD